MLIDGHVHLHPGFPVGAALDAAARVASPAKNGSAIGLWLVETRREGALDRLKKADAQPWKRSRVDDVTWRFRREDGSCVTLVAGRQVTTAEDLEILLVGTSDAPADGRPLHAMVEAWLGGPALVLLPWGFGKWTGSRGRLVEEAYERYAGDGLRLADTGVRPAWMRRPRLFERSERDGYPVYAGSDPFPFEGQVASIGSAGFVCPGADPDWGWPKMREHVLGLRPPVRMFGGGTPTLKFVKSQLRMQARKRLGGRG